MENGDCELIDLTNWEVVDTPEGDTLNVVLNSATFDTFNAEPEADNEDQRNTTSMPWSLDEDLLLAEGVALHTSRDPATRSVDWYLVAKHVRSRSVSECCFQWLQKVRDEVYDNLTATWSQNEIDILCSATVEHVIDNAHINWVLVAEQLPGRTALQCCVQWMRGRYASIVPPKQSHVEDERLIEICGRWSENDDSLLKNAVARFSRSSWSEDALWPIIIKLTGLPFTPIQCQIRWAVLCPDPLTENEMEMLLHKIKGNEQRKTSPQSKADRGDVVVLACRGKEWSAEEDGKLLEAIDKSFATGKIDWKNVVNILNGAKSQQQCVYRFHHCLAPFLGVKMGPWTSQEDALLQEAVQRTTNSEGIIDWMEVVKLMDCSRTAQQCSERWEERNRNGTMKKCTAPIKHSQAPVKLKQLNGVDAAISRASKGRALGEKMILPSISLIKSNKQDVYFRPASFDTSLLSEKNMRSSAPNEQCLSRTSLTQQKRKLSDLYTTTQITQMHFPPTKPHGVCNAPRKLPPAPNGNIHIKL